MRTISIINPKGGCGKTTIATSLAAALSWESNQVALADMDPQQSASDWLALRPADYPAIEGLSIEDDGQMRASYGTDVMVIDAPAATYGTELGRLVRRSDTILVPVLPSPIDMRATYRFLQKLYELKHIQQQRAKVGLIANRVRPGSVVYRELTGFLGGLRAPFVAHLRQNMNYIRAAEGGLAVADLPGYLARPDWDQWERILKWLRSVKSKPRRH